MRKGFTLIEFLIATSLAGVVAAAITTTLVGQQRFYSTAQEKLELRNRLRETSNILSAEIKGAAVSEMGIPLMTDTALELYTSIGTSIACTVNGNSIGLPPQLLARGNSLTSIVAMPDTGDLALIYGSPSAFPDSGLWYQHRLSSVTSRAASATCPTSSGFTTAPDIYQGITALQLILSSPASANVRAGSPIHFVRRGRYSIYKSGDTWHLGYRRCNSQGPSVCGTVQPVSGPYLPVSVRDRKGGLTFSYFNSAGAPINSAQAEALARVDVVIRSNMPKFSGLTTSTSMLPETLKISISPRNRVR